jgi:hypothetical protein
MPSGEAWHRASTSSVLRFAILRFCGSLCLICVFPGPAPAAQEVRHPFQGVTHVARQDAQPRPLRMHVVTVDLAAPGIRFLVTPPSGPKETRKQTTLQFLTERRAQIAINAHFFEPWPAPSPDDGSADLVGIAASGGRVYSPFDAKPPKQFAIHPNAPGLNLDANNRATIVHRNPADPSGLTAAEPVKLYNTVCGNEQILAAGRVTAADSAWNNKLSPRTAVGIAEGNRLVLLAVDGRQPRVSEGMTVREVAELLRRDFHVTDALSLDGGGSTTLAMADPTPRVVNVPVGAADAAGTQRAVGSNLAVFASPVPRNTPTSASAPASAPAPTRALLAPGAQAGIASPLVAAAAILAWRILRRRRA